MEKNHQWPQFLAVFFASIFSIGNGIQLGWPAPSLPKLFAGDLGYEISERDLVYLITLSPLGYILGSPLSGFLLDRIGRKYTLLAFAPIQIITWLTIALSNNVIALYAARIMMGMTEGGMFTALPAYVGEVMEPKVRGRAGTSISLGILAGTLLINSYGSYITIRAAAYVSLIFPIMFILTFVWMPDSPYYYAAKGVQQEARKSLQALRRRKDVESELLLITKGVQRQMSEPGRFKDIFIIKSNLRAFGILLLLRTVQQLSGMFAISFYMQVIFDDAESTLSPALSAIICNGVRLLLSFGGSFLVDRFGRKIMISISCSGTAVILVTIGTYFYVKSVGYNISDFKWLPLVCIVVYYIVCSVGLLIVPTLMMGELLGSSIKAKALTIMNIFFGLLMSLSAMLFQWTKNTFGMHTPFYIYATCCVFGVIITYTCVPETKGKTLEEIQQKLKRVTNTKESKTLLQQVS